MASVIQWDVELFAAINSLHFGTIMDAVLIAVRNPLLWIPLYGFVITHCLLKYRKTGYYVILFSILTVASTDLISSRVVKPYVERPRPCHLMSEEEINERVHCGNGYSFTSSHAANHMGLSIFWIIAIGIRKKWYQFILILWALLIGFAQVYVGVHYPLDILSGFILGGIIARGWGSLFKASFEINRSNE